MSVSRNVAALLKLLAWMSPAFPVGAFSYSGGLESAVNDRRLSSANDLRNWILLLLRRGTLWNDAVLLAQAWRCHAEPGELAELCELGRALAGSAERYRETVLLGDAFLSAATAWPQEVLNRLSKETPYPVAVGAVASAHGIRLEDALAAYLHSGVSQYVSAGIRLGISGQKDGVAILAQLESDITDVAERAVASVLADLGSATILADTSSMRHEIQETRLFRS